VREIHTKKDEESKERAGEEEGEPIEDD